MAISLEVAWGEDISFVESLLGSRRNSVVLGDDWRQLTSREIVAKISQAKGEW